MRKELSQTRNAKVISSSHDSLILKLNNSSTHFSFYQHKPFDSPPASHSPDLTSTVQLFYSDFWFPSITFQLRNHRSLVGAVTVPCQSQHIWTLRRLPVGLCYLGQNRAAAIALPCSGGLNRQKLTKKTHIKKNATFVLMMFFDVFKVFVNVFLNLCSTATGLLYDWDLGMKKETDSRKKLSEGEFQKLCPVQTVQTIRGTTIGSGELCQKAWKARPEFFQLHDSMM